MEALSWISGIIMFLYLIFFLLQPGYYSDDDDPENLVQ